MTPKQLIQQFITERLDGDINNFVNYDLAQLEGDKVFYCQEPSILTSARNL